MRNFGRDLCCQRQDSKDRICLNVSQKLVQGQFQSANTYQHGYLDQCDAINRQRLISGDCIIQSLSLVFGKFFGVNQPEHQNVRIQQESWQQGLGVRRFPLNIGIGGDNVTQNLRFSRPSVFR